MDKKQKLHKALLHLGQELRAGQEQLKESLHLLRPIMILPFYGYGSDTFVYLKGRVIEKDKKQDYTDEGGAGEQTMSMLRRYALSAIPQIRVAASFAGMHQEVETNDEGFFELRFNAEAPINYQQSGYIVKLRLLERKTDEDEMEAESRVFVPEPDARFGIISDMDDTVLVADATSFLGQLRRTLLKDAEERRPFPGIAALLQVLQGRNNPLFYVSSSQWNLYSFLDNFLEAHDLPKAPLLLHDRSQADNKKQEKYTQICQILATYPHLPFLLIGDSGETDPEIYRQLSRAFPDQVQSIYIRDVTDDGRAEQVQEICRQVEAQGIMMLLVNNTMEAAEHAFKHGWISLPQLHQVAEAQQQKKQP